MAKAKKNNEFFDGIMSGASEILESLRGKKQLTARKLVLPKPPRAMKPKEIITLREKRLKVSQTVFASLLNVNPGTVRAWEQGVNQPNGATLRLLQITRKQPEILIQYLA